MKGKFTLMCHTANNKGVFIPHTKNVLRLFLAVVCLLTITEFVTPVYAQKPGIESLRNTSSLCCCCKGSFTGRSLYSG
ncbi:MAG: hypothetical protein MRK02_15085 [Candidatus Scalindua sp.]|nr:hypothetical protein [Candidatus Scalindua sp.]